MTMDRATACYAGRLFDLLETREGIGEMSESGGLSNHLDGAEAQRLLDLVVVGMTGEDHHGQLGVAGANARESSEAAQPRHDEVQEDPIDPCGLQQLDRLRCVQADQRSISVGPDGLGDHLGDRRLIVDDENAHPSPHGRVSRPLRSAVKE